MPTYSPAPTKYVPAASASDHAGSRRRHTSQTAMARYTGSGSRAKLCTHRPSPLMKARAANVPTPGRRSKDISSHSSAVKPATDQV